MAKFISGQRLGLAVERLRNSRASGGMINFLILKRALRLDPEGWVKLSSKDSALQKAIDELTLWPEGDAERPFINVFGQINAKNLGTIGPKYRSNGPADTLRNGTWSNVVEIGEGERCKTARLKDGYIADLKRMTLVKDLDRPMPVLSDAAVWFLRRTDVEDSVTGQQENAGIERALAERFAADLGLTDEEMGILFVEEPAEDA